MGSHKAMIKLMREMAYEANIRQVGITAKEYVESIEPLLKNNFYEKCG